MTLRLSQKAYILILVPLSCELVFIGALFAILTKTETEVREARHAQLIATQISMLTNTYFRAAAVLIAYVTSKNESFALKFNEATKEIPKQFKVLKELTKSDAELAKDIATIEHSADNLLKLMHLSKEEVEVHGQLLDGASVRRKTKLVMSSLLSQLRRLSDQQQEKLALHPDVEERMQSLLKLCLLCGVVLNIVVAFGLALYFNRGTSRRFAVLVDNARNLSTSKGLHRPLQGSDEIARVDKALHEMAESLERLIRKERTIVENAMDAICSLDATGIFLRASPSCQRVLGYSPEALVGRSFLELVSPEERDRVKAVIEDTVLNGEANQFEARIDGANGKTLDMIWSAQWSPQDKSMVCIGHDISQRRELERLKQEFTAMVSHDLRAPLCSIQAFLSLLERNLESNKFTNEKLAKDINVARSEATRLLSLVNELLDIERLESRPLKLNLQSVSMLEVVNCAVESISAFAEQQGIQIEVNGANLKAVADSDRLMQVLINLFSNAIKFSPAQSLVRVSVLPIAEWVEVRVSDTGVGVPPSHHNFVFSRFYQVGSNADAERKGSGLGLAICKAVIEQHGGKIGVESTDGMGSTFWFRIKRCTDKASSEFQESTQESAAL